jgi:Protein of unknown function (DUF2851)
VASVPSTAERYAQLRESSSVRERAPFAPPRLPTELELQARWFAGDFGRRFHSAGGDDVEIAQFGTWNREAGPDFRDAAIRLNSGEAIRGSIEFDLSDRSWETHGHATNPAFEDTVLHVFVNAGTRAFFSRTKSNRNVVQVRVDTDMLDEVFAASVPLARPGRCQAPLRDLAEGRIRGVLDGAAQFRLQRKAMRFRRIAESHGRDEAFFQELAAALGYKQNKLPFALLAQRLPLKSLRQESEDAEALLFGIAGFLSAPDLGVYETATRSYIRTLWDRWWPHRDELERLILPQKLWHLSGARPLNHPQRRLAALAALVRRWPAFIKSLGNTDGSATRKFFLSLQHPFWNFHYTLRANTTPKEMALIGDARIADILANALFPFFSVEGRDAWREFAKLPAKLSNRRLETAATRLFGDDPRRPLFMKTVAHQQGLLQIYDDFCLQDNSDCAQCPFPEQMQKWK